MSDPADAALALARLRARGAIPMPADPAQLAEWEAAARRGGRRLVDVTGAAAQGRVALGWIEGSEPAAGADAHVERTPPSRVLLLVFAACLRACWPDRSDHPYPGSPAGEEEILRAVAALGPLTSRVADAGPGGEWHRKGALRRLLECGLLERVDGTKSGMVRLGPLVGLWSDLQVSTLRATYGQLPVDDRGRS